MLLLNRVKYMLLVAVFGVIAIWVACSDKPPVAPEPAGKAAQDETEIVQFTDRNLRRAVEQTLRKPPAAQLTTADMAALTRLYAEEKGIVSLAGLEQATALDTLSLWGNKIVDVSPLASLTNLRFLNLGNNQIADASPLASLPNLRWLSLWGNELDDVSALKSLTRLTSLNLWGNEVEDASALAGLTRLRWLNVGNTQIADASPLDSLTNLEWLGLEGSRVRAYEIPKQISALTEEGVAIDIFEPPPPEPPPVVDPDATYFFVDSDVESKVRAALEIPQGFIKLSDMASLTELDLTEFSYATLEDLKIATGLQELVLTSSGVTDAMLASLSGLVSLQKLLLSGNSGVTDAGLALLSGLVNLEELVLTGTGATDAGLVSLSGLANLETLELDDTRITDVSALGTLTSLITLDLDDTRITSVSALGTLISLVTLELDNTRITSVEPLKPLTSLVTLNLNGTRVADVEPLLSLTSLNMLDLRGVATLTTTSANTHIPALVARGVTVLNDGPWVTFAEANVESVVRAALQIPTLPITVATMAAFTGDLVLSDQGIVNLAGLEHATGLTVLSLSGNMDLRDLDELSSLTSLRTLSLGGTDITNASLNSLQGLTSLQELHLDNTRLTNRVLRDQVGSLTSLRRLNLERTDITDISRLSTLTNLRHLHLDNTRVTSVSALRPLSNLETLTLTGVITLDAASVNTHIPALEAAGVMVTHDLVTISDAKIRKAIRVALGKSQEIFFKPELLTITSINGQGQGIVDLTGLELLANLEELDLDLNGDLVDLSKLSGLTSLKILHLTNTGVTDLSPLSGLTNLETLTLNGTGVTDVSALSGLSSLETLHMSHTRVVNLQPLVGLSNLETLYLLGVTTLNSASKNTHIPALIANGVTVNRGGSQEVVFGDSKVRNKVRDALNIPTRTITRNDMAKLIKLDLNNVKVITSLRGLEYAVALQELDLRFTFVEDGLLSRLSDLITLQRLNLKGNSQLGDGGMTHLTGLVNMKRLWLDGTLIGDTGVGRLSTLVNLEWMVMEYHGIGNPSIVTMSKLPKMIHIDVEGCDNITDLTPLLALTNLQFLDVKSIDNLTQASRDAIETLRGRGVTVEADDPD